MERINISKETNLVREDTKNKSEDIVSQNNEEKTEKKDTSPAKERKDEIERLKTKFKELRSLVYQYKDSKDNEIDILKKEHEKFADQLENLNNGYEKIIDDASNQLQEFITKNNFS